MTPAEVRVLSSQCGPSGSWNAGTAPAALSAPCTLVKSFRDADGEPAGGFMVVRLHEEDDLGILGASGEFGGVLPGKGSLFLVRLGQQLVQKVKVVDAVCHALLSVRMVLPDYMLALHVFLPSLLPAHGSVWVYP